VTSLRAVDPKEVPSSGIGSLRTAVEAEAPGAVLVVAKATFKVEVEGKGGFECNGGTSNGVIAVIAEGFESIDEGSYQDNPEGTIGGTTNGAIADAFKDDSDPSFIPFVDRNEGSGGGGAKLGKSFPKVD
jgi:hypothetical protein